MDRPVAEDVAPSSQNGAYLLDTEVRRLGHDRQDDILASLDASRTPIAAQGFRLRFATFQRQSFPPADARRADPEPLGYRTMRQARGHRRQNPHPKIDRKRCSHIRRPPTGQQLESSMR